MAVVLKPERVPFEGPELTVQVRVWEASGSDTVSRVLMLLRVLF